MSGGWGGGERRVGSLNTIHFLHHHHYHTHAKMKEVVVGSIEYHP